jgi:predicted kinase
VFAKDWLEATLIRSGLKPTSDDRALGFAGYELLIILAERQLMLGQAVILDSVAASLTIRDVWRQLSDQYGADWRVIECICSDESLHRARLKDRQRNIPGWHELEWSEVERVKTYYSAWEEERLVLDMKQSFNENFLKAKTYCE